MIGIYKKLPGTNCGKCGLPTCMALAMKVKKSQAELSDCPFVIPQLERTGSGASPFSSYEQVSAELETAALRVDFRKAAAAIGGTYGFDSDRETIRLSLMNRAYELRKEGLFENGIYCSDPWTKIIVYDYVRRMGERPLTGEWISLGNFPRTASHVKALQAAAEKKIATRYKDDLEGLRQRCAELGGAEIRAKIKADYICSLDLLPHLPVYLSFWAADEEFDADCKLLFDSNAEDHIDIEFLGHLIERFIEELVNE